MQAVFSEIVNALADQGWHVHPDFLPGPAVAALREECRRRHERGGFHAAGVGSGTPQLASEVRGDHIHWLEADDPQPQVADYLRLMEALRQNVNRELFLGLDSLETHFAFYAPGTFYKRHLDRFRDDDRRTLTAIVYLNDDWTPADGGQLRFWPDAEEEGTFLDIPPSGGTLVTFLSHQFWHEVLPARRDRMALTGWFKRR